MMETQFNTVTLRPNNIGKLSMQCYITYDVFDVYTRCLDVMRLHRHQQTLFRRCVHAGLTKETKRKTPSTSHI